MPAASGATELMDRIYRPQRVIYDLTRKYYLFGRDQLIADLAAGHGAVLEIGCGTGRNLVAAGRRYSEASLFGIDVSTVMLETAQANLARHGLAQRSRTALADATDFDPSACLGRGAFDRIFFSYTLSMIPDWKAALSAAADRLAPGGRLHVVDFGQLDGYPAFARHALAAWLQAFHVHPVAELPQAMSELAERNGVSLRWRPLMRGYAVSAVLERPA